MPVAERWMFPPASPLQSDDPLLPTDVTSAEILPVSTTRSAPDPPPSSHSFHVAMFGSYVLARALFADGSIVRATTMAPGHSAWISDTSETAFACATESEVAAPPAQPRSLSAIEPTSAMRGEPSSER